MSPSPEILLPYREHARTFLGFAYLLLAAAGISAACGASIVGIALSAVAVTPLAVGAMLAFIARGYERRAAALLAGESWISWTYSEAQWREHVAAERGRGKYLGLMMVLVFALAGFGVAMGIAEDGGRLFESRELVWVLPPLGGAVFGLGVAAVIGWHRRRTLARMANAQGVFCLGEEGMYLTGSYWPWRGAGIRLLDVRQDGGALVFHFRVTRGGDPKVRVPIAHGHEEAARQLVERLG